VTTLPGLEKFSHFEDKLYRAVEFCKTLMQQCEQLQQENLKLKEQVATLSSENTLLTEQIQKLDSEREEIRTKVESMLAAIAFIDSEITESLQ
jgi:uncharacterized coiled-coil DUF342 family protein